MSMKTIWILRISAIAGIILLIWFFFFSQWSSCNRGDYPDIELAKPDSTAQKKIDSLQQKVEGYKKQADSLKKCFAELEQTRHEILVKAKTETKIAEFLPMGELYPQMRKWLSGTRPLNLKTYPFDSLDVLSMAKKKIEHDWLKQDNGLLADEVHNLNLQITNYKWQVSDLNQIINFKDEQIGKLEGPRVSYKVSNRKWYVDAGMILGSAAFGFTAGIIYKNLTK